ncbi:hypothetical protein HRbin08_01717 [bacterium HR08]|nr:hypothetical protein HRbin08_01717 [bacterium HR08]
MPLLLEGAQSGKAAHANGRHISREDARRLLDVFAPVAIHDDALAVLDRPGLLPDVEHHGLPAQLPDGDLHRDARAERGVEEEEGDGSALQGASVPERLVLDRQIEHLG